MRDLAGVRARALPAQPLLGEVSEGAVEAPSEVVEAPSEVIVAAVVRDRLRVAVDLVTLTKPRVAVMVLVTTLVGYYVALEGGPDYVRMLHLVVGTLLAAGGAMALNQYWERDVDARMERTRSRPLPDRRLQPLEALVFGGAITVAGLAYLGVFVSVLAALLTLATAALYLFAYTPLKLRSALCTVVGAVPGALPPVTGWVAARQDLGIGAWVLFGILFLWQLPHTLAIARLYQEDYARAGVRVLPVVDTGGSSTERQIVSGCLGLLAVSLLPTLVGLAGPLYFLGALLLGVVFAIFGLLQALEPSAPAARRVLLASLLYLPAVLALLALDKV
jgi:protoheme IX farnesyltransferase